MADLKTTNIYGDAYINNKVGINTNTPATRLQIGQLSPTAATEGIQFGDDTGARIYRDSATIIKVAGGFTSTSYILAGNYLQTAGNLIYPSSQTATQRLEVGNASGNAWITGISIAQGGNVTVFNNLTANGNISAANLSGTNTGDQTVGNGTITIAAGTGISVASNTFTTNQTGNSTVTITNSSPNATHTGDVTGATALTIANDAVTTAKILNANVTNAKLANSSLTIGSTAISLGATATTIAGLTSVTSTTFVGALTGNASTATALTSMNISQFTNNSGYLTSAVTSLAGTTNRITVSGATGAVTLNLPQDIHTGASPTFSGLTVTGITMTNLTGAYQNTTVYDSPRTQSATPSRGIRAPASSIQFTDSYAIAPFYTYRSTGDWPVPYGIGWGTGGESSGIFQRYASNGSSFGDMIFYTGNDGSGAFSFRRHTWEGTTYFAAGSGELNTELFRIDWAGNLTMLGTLNGSANSATLYANNGSYGSWKIGGTRNGWYGIEFDSGVSLMANSSEVGFHRNGHGWQMWWSGGTGYVHKGNPGGGTQATILDSSNASFAWNMNQNVRTTDIPTFAGVYSDKFGINDGGMDCYINITDANPTFNYEAYGGEFLFYGDKDRPSSLLYVGGIDVSRTIIANAISSRDYTRQLFPGGGYYHEGGSVTGAIKIRFPVNTKTRYPMLSFTCHIYNYSTGTSVTFKIGGHYSDSQWYNVFAYSMTDSGVNYNVRWGYEGTYLAVWIGETNTGWSYPNVFITDFQNGYSAIDGIWMTGWSVTRVTAFDTVTNGPYAPGHFWNQKNDGAGSGLDADLLDGYNSATAGTANTIVLRDSSGHITGQYILGSYFNASAGNGENPTIGQIWTQNTSDNYLRKSTPAHFRSQVTDGSYPSLTGANASGTWSISISGNAATATSAVTATSADNIDGRPFVNTNSNSATNADSINSNGISYYNGGVTNFSGNATDGALYSQAYSNDWQHQIAGDYRSGQIALRGKNNGTWQSWRTVLDSTNYSSYAGGLSTGNTFTNTNVFYSPNNTTIGGLSGNYGLTVYQGTAGTDAYMTFHIGGDFAGYFGLGGAENDLVWGGWSVGNFRYRILHSSNAAYAWNMNQYVRTTDSPTFNTVTANITGNAYNNLSNDYKDIYVYGDVNTYYIVLIQGEYLYSFGRYSVTRGYNWTGPDTWNTATHKGGLTLDWEWSGDTAWGGNDKAIRIIEFNESYSTMVAGLGYPVNGGVIIWLRGGGVNGAQYRIRTPNGSNSTVTVYDGLSIANHVASTTFTAADSTVFSSRANTNNVSAEILARYPVRATGGLFDGNNAVLHAGNYNSYSPTLTGTGASGTWSINVTGNAATATTLQTARAINGVSFNGSAAITVNGLNYNVNNDWLRENGDDDHFKLYGNSRTMIYRTDGNTNSHGGGAFAHIFYYGGSADANRMFIINTDGRLWSPYHGWLDTMSISGNAATVTNGIYTTNYWTGTPLGKRRYRIHSSDGTSLNSSITNLECGFTYGGSGEPTGPFIAFGGLGGSIDYSCQLVGAYSGGGNDFKIRTRNDDTAAWNTWRTIVTDGNYTSYSPTLTGTGASGNWAINVTGNAATATTLQTARNINGTSFNGSADITTATWGTARTLTIGSTGKSVDGSAAITWSLAEIGAAATNQTMFIGTTSVAINRASAAISLAGTSIDGTAGGLNSSNYISRIGSSGNYNTDFQNTPAGTVRHQGDDANITNTPGGTWWFVDNYRHSNASNYWGTQVAWGWEDNANKLATRNITGNSFGGWVYYLNSVNYTDYTVTKTGTGASGTWGINITGNAATATTATNVTIANGSVTLAKIENITAYTILGNSNASAAATPAALSVATVATMLSGQTMNINGSSTSCSGTAANATTAGGLEVHTGTNNEANKIVRTQGNGYIMAGWINTISGDNGTTAIDRVYASSDGYIRYYTPANFRTVLDVPTRAGSGASGNWAINITGNAATATSATSATTATNVAASGITGQTGMWTSAARPGPYRLYRNDHDSAYNLQLTWQAHRTNYWSLRGFLDDTFHAECFVVYSGYADEAGALTIGNTYRVANLGINVAASNRLHINGDGTNPPIRIDNPALGSGASNSRSFHGWLPISIGGTTKYIQLYN